MFDSGLIWYGEIRCQSLLGLKGLILQTLFILLEENRNILFVLCGHDCQFSTMYCFPAKLMLVKFYFSLFPLPNKIMMNASVETLPVTSMHTVPTLWVPITVPARKDTLAMDARVQVNYYFNQ